MQNVIKNYIQITTPKYAVIAVIVTSIVFAILRLLQATTWQIWESINKNAICHIKPLLSRTAIAALYAYATIPIQLQALTRQMRRYHIIHAMPKYRFTAIINPYPCMTMPISYKPSTSQIGSHKPLPKTGNRYKKDKNICKKRLDK